MTSGLIEIILVEDDQNDADLTMHALRKAKVTNAVRHLKDGAEALDYFFREGATAPHGTAILLDLKLPKVSGLEVLKRLKSDPRTATIPVIMLTSSREDRDVAEAYKLGVNSYIVKPVDFEQFTQAVCTLGLYWMLLNTPPIN